MTARQEGLLLIGGLLIFSFFFQIQMKHLASDIDPILAKSGQTVAAKLLDLMQAALSWRAVLVVLLALALFTVWLLALIRLELSMALPLASVALIINAIGSGLLLGEAMTMTRVIGVLTVAAGIGLVLKS